MFSRRPTSTPLLVWWQSAVWPRSPGRFWAALTNEKPPQRVDRMMELNPPGPNAHDSIVPMAFESLVRELLPEERDT